MFVKYRLIGLASTVALTALLTGCGSGDGGGAAESGGNDPHQIPAPFSSKLPVPYINYAPYSYLDPQGTMIGIGPDVAEALSAELGIPLETSNATFEATLLGVQQGKYAWAPAAEITTERLKTFDFVSYLIDAYRFISKASAPPIGETPMDLCGMTIGVTTGGSAIPALEKFSSDCTAGGKEPIEVQTFPDQTANQLAVSSDRIDAATATVTNAAYQMSLSKDFQVSGPRYAESILGLTVRKGNGMAAPLAAAMNRLIESGTYTEILAKYNLADAAITKSEVNPDPGR